MCFNNFWRPVFLTLGPIKKKKLSLEPLLILATFIDGKINFQYFFLNLNNRLSPPYSPPPKKAKIFLILLFHIQNFNQLLLKFFSYSKTHKWLVVKKLGSFLNSKGLK